MSEIFCEHCGKAHDPSDMDVGYEKPYAYYEIPKHQVKDRVSLTSDLCVIDGTHYYLRGIVEIPVHGREQTFGFGIWAEVSKKSYDRYVRLYDDDAQANESPFPGIIATQIKRYPKMLGLPIQVHLVSATTQPSFTLLEPYHLLTVEQQNGISIQRLLEILHPYFK